MRNRNLIILFCIVVLLSSCSSNDGSTSANPTLSIAPSEPKIEEAKVQVTRHESLDKVTLKLTPLALLRNAESLFTFTLRGEWDNRDALLEKSNREDKSEYKVWMEFEWKSVNPFQTGSEELQFLVDDQLIEGGRATILQIPPLQPTGSFSARITAKIPLNYLERVATAQRAKMQLGGFVITLDQIVLSKLREFTEKALEIREDQMSHLR